MAKTPTSILAHWNVLIEGLQASPLEFYAQVEQALERRQIPAAKRSRVDWREGGLMSAKREYLRVQRYEHVIDICGAPFGAGFFVSWWLGEYRGCLARLADNPWIGWLAKPVTYYRIDTANMFRTAVEAAVQEVIGEISEAKGIRQLTPEERKPMLKEFWQK